MLVLLNVINIILVSVFCIAFAVSMVDYLIFQKKLFGILAILFVLFELDVAVISLTENVPWFKRIYDETFLSVPTWKTLIYTGIFMALLVVVPKIMGMQYSRFMFTILGALVLYLLFIPVIPDSAMKAWLYYEPNQLFMLLIGIWILVSDRKMAPTFKDERIESMIRFGGWLFIIFAIAIFAEDTYVIFFVDDYKNTVYINNRSVTEDLFRIILSVNVIRAEYMYLNMHMYADLFEPKSVSNDEAAAEPEERRYSKLFLYSKEHQLTVREQEILGLLITGKKTQEIADTLQISIGTAKTHIHNIFAKVGVSRRTLLIKNYDDYTAEEFTLKKINEIFS